MTLECFSTYIELAAISLMFVPCISRCSINNQHYALNYITSLFYVHAPTYFGSILTSSGSFLDPCELLEQIGGISYNVSVACVPECCGSVR
jgi:hypothetical protein